jgi:hypothetical protein
MSDLWERVKKTAGEIYSTASERTVEGVHIGVKHLDLVSIRRELSREFAGLGGRVYQLLRRDRAADIPDDPTVVHHLKRLEELEERLEEREAEIRRLREGKPERAENASSEASAGEHRGAGDPGTAAGAEADRPPGDAPSPADDPATASQNASEIQALRNAVAPGEPGPGSGAGDRN